METKSRSEPQGAENILDIGILDVEALEFYKNPKGFIALRVGDKDYKRVKLSRILPFSDPFRYISVSDMSENEIGILKDVSELPDAQQELVKEELESRYLCPEISKIETIKEKMGYYYFEVEIGEYKKIFAVKDISRSIKQISENSIIITDADGNRYLIPDIWAINAKSRRKIEPYFY
jgi:hypothetical protein